MNIDYIEVFRKDPNNVGDMYSNPLRYFNENNTKKVKSIDIDNLTHVEFGDDIPIIVGGGGLIENEHFGRNVKRIVDGADMNSLIQMNDHRWKCQSPNNEQVFADFQTRWQKLYSSTLDKIRKNKGPKVIWGAGHNINDGKCREITWPDWMGKFTLIGIRDYMQGYEWVPCASCMHPAFDNKYEVTNEIIWFEHKKQLIKGVEMNCGSVPIPRFANSGQNFEQTISILGSANVVVTNSYHGVYWATLLNKKVVCVDPWSSKFWFFRHKPSYCRTKEWYETTKIARSFPNALEECRNANRNFWNKVKNL